VLPAEDFLFNIQQRKPAFDAGIYPGALGNPSLRLRIHPLMNHHDWQAALVRVQRSYPLR
jgi:hypothetical protein